MVSFIVEHREEYGVEPICSLLPIAPSTFYDHQAKQLDPEQRSERAKRDDALVVDIRRVWAEHFRVYGARKVSRQLHREEIPVARCTVERLMQRLGIEGARRGPWRRVDEVEYATLEWVDWFNNRWLLEPIGNIPPAEMETAYYRQQKESAMVA